MSFALLVFVSLCNYVLTFENDMEGRIVKGHSVSDIKQFPFVALVSITYHSVFNTESWICCSSILNQKFLITAGHCVRPRISIYAVMGHVNRDRGKKMFISGYKRHEGFSEDDLSNDIAILTASESISLNRWVERVSVLRSPPDHELAVLAGWGAIDEKYDFPSHLQEINNIKIRSVKYCKKKLGDIPSGFLCAKQYGGNAYPSIGDSGSPLMLRKFIQIGIVSHNYPGKDVHIAVYTNVSYHYDWIVTNTKTIMKQLFCTFKYSNDNEKIEHH